MINTLRVLTLASHLLSNDRAPLIGDVAARVAMREEPIFAGPDAEQRTANFLVVFAAKESNGDPLVIGDHGHAWGLMQIHYDVWEHLVQGSILDLFDTETSMETSLRIVRYLTVVCGSPRRALYAYASGPCDGLPEGRRKVNERCALIGGC